jgi:RNA 2',3'-cyclic 3'-phosphodiesterase
VRTFIAVDFPPPLLEKIAEITAFFKTLTSEKDLKWVETKNLHLTIKFLGEIDEQKAAQVKRTLSYALKDQHSFEIEISGLGMYPNKNKPRVIWLGITGAGPLADIYNVINSELAKLEIQPEHRAFSPHLTIARIRNNTDDTTAQQIGKSLKKYQVDPLGGSHHRPGPLLSECSDPIRSNLHPIAFC